MAIRTATPFCVCALLFWLCTIMPSISPLAFSGEELSLVVSNSTTLQISPELLVGNSSGSKPARKDACSRIKIHGLPRLKHLKKLANSVKVKVSYANLSARPRNVEVCFHRNTSLGIGMCPQGQWENLVNGLWSKSISPFDHKLLDIRVSGSSLPTLEVSLDEEFFLYRVIFLMFGIVLMTMASSLSKSLVFYYGSAMAIGVILVILVILFQGMKLLPTGRKSSLAIFLYSFIIGLGSFLFQYVPRIMRSLLMEIGVVEDVYNPLSIFLVVFVVLAGAWLGFWIVRKVVLLEDGSIDVGISHIVGWSIRIFAASMILQCSLDRLLAAEALVCGILFPSMSRRIFIPWLMRHLYKDLRTKVKSDHRYQNVYSSPVVGSYSSKPFPGAPSLDSTVTSPMKLSDSKTFYSTYHTTPEKRKFSKEEWENFTRDSTKKALEELVSSPDFSRWAVVHADRITLAPKKETAHPRRRWLPWT